MTRREQIEETLGNFPVCEYAFGSAEKIPFSERVREVCRTDCPRYGHCWACPPAVGEVDECIARCKVYDSWCLFSTICEGVDEANMDDCLRVKKEHEAVTGAIRRELDGRIGDFLVLGTGCNICETCTCPDAPCRFPDERLSSMESHGIVLVNMVEQAGLCFDYGPGTVTYFSIILYNE